MKRLIYLLLFLFFFSNAFSQGKIKVACIGDSITEGDGLKKDSESYPSQLQNLLGYDGFDVRNFGKSGTTMLKDLNGPNNRQWSYWEDIKKDGNGGKELFDSALAWQPDIIIIKFGTNDARDITWTSEANGEDGNKNFYHTYVEFIDSFKLNSINPIIFICYPIPSLEDQTPNQIRRIREEVIPIVKQVARKSSTHIIDLHSAFQGKINLMQEDGVHPTAEGATLIAEEVFKMIKMTYEP